MTPARRWFLRLAGAAAVLPAVAPAALAQAYPARPVHFVVGFPAGGPNDILARLIGQFLSERLGQPFVIDNRPGAAGNTATAEVARAPADGHTLLLVGPANAINASLHQDPDVDFLRDIVPVAGIAREPLVMVVAPPVPAKDVAELIAFAKAHPGQVKMASTGAGSAPHVAGELFRMMTGVDLLVVQYAGGGPALKAVSGGDAQVMFEPMSAAIAPIRSGQLRPLAVTTASRSLALPDVPTVGELMPGYEASAVTGVGVPASTPAAIVDTLNHAINAALADPVVSARLTDAGSTVLPGSPADFAQIVAGEIDKWAKVVRASGAKAD